MRVCFFVRNTQFIHLAPDVHEISHLQEWDRRREGQPENTTPEATAMILTSDLETWMKYLFVSPLLQVSCVSLNTQIK